MEKVLNTHKITKYFYEPDKFQVLKEVDLSVNRGEFLSLVGKSGCGKSTLMYVLSTMDTDYEGELEIAGQRLTGKNQNELAKFRNEHIGFVFQFHYLLPEFTVLQNVMIPALKLGKYSHSEIEDRAIEKLKLLGMQEHARKPSSKLSGGQQQRVAIARALVNEPVMILADEATGNLDTRTSYEIMALMQDLNKEQGKTIVFVTHEPDIAAFSSRTVMLRDGEVVKDTVNDNVRSAKEALAGLPPADDY